MSGHSHFASIKHKKELTDQKRGQMFSKMAQVIAMAARQGGPNPETNYRLRLAIDKAKEVNMPRENVERAIKRGSGGDEGAKLEEVIFEGYGPGGVAIMVTGITDNKNRTFSEVRQILNQNGGKIVGEGAIRWLFEQKGVAVIDPKSQPADLQNKENLELAVIEAGADDIYWHDDVLDVHTKPENLETLRKNLEAKGIKVESASMDMVPKEPVEADEATKEACQKLFDALDENDSVQDVYSNLKL